ARPRPGVDQPVDRGVRAAVQSGGGPSRQPLWDDGGDRRPHPRVPCRGMRQGRAHVPARDARGAGGPGAGHRGDPRRLMVDHARVVVIGGGITGVSVASHRAEAGWTDVVRVEKAGLTAGSTSQAAGLVTAFNPSSTMLTWRKYSIELYGKLGAFSPVGSVRLASSPEQLKELERTASRARGVGLDVGVVSAAEARRLLPAISPESLYGAVYLPGDGFLDPHSATFAVANAARALGVRIRQNARVTGFELGHGREIRRVL